MTDEYMSKPCPISTYFQQASPLAYGCMGLGGAWGSRAYEKHHLSQAHNVIDSAMESGINFFDHADIYTLGNAEKVFGEVLKSRPALRDKMIIQSKCGIRFDDDQGPKRFDFSADHIKTSVDGILRRLNTEHLDILLLHRPDPLMEPDEVAQTFSELKQSGKVAHFGVSNMNAQQIQYLQHYMDLPLIVNQVELHLLNLDWLDEVVLANNPQGKDLTFSSGTIEYCAINNVQIQSWGSLCQGLLSGRPVDEQPEHIQKTARRVQQLAAEYQTSSEAIVLAFLQRHPSAIQPVIGTTSPERIKACAMANDITLSREHWYSLYVSARGQELP